MWLVSAVRLELLCTSLFSLLTHDKDDTSYFISLSSFSNLFSSSDSLSRPASRRSALPPATIKYSAPTRKVSPQGDPYKKHRDTAGDKGKAYDFLQDDL